MIKLILKNMQNFKNQNCKITYFQANSKNRFDYSKFPLLKTLILSKFSCFFHLEIIEI